MPYQAPRGTVDILPEDQPYWDHVRAIAQKVAVSFGFRRIDTPAFEETGLFVRGVGEGTDIVEKEMYTFDDRGGDSMTLRPEGTAPACRAYIQHGMSSLPQPVRLFYITPIFRYERPQAGRYRQHHQFGCEAIGDADPLVDAEVIQLAWTYLNKLGIKGLTLYLNSIGEGEGRKTYLKELVAYYTPHADRLCRDCKVRLVKNPLRLLDCKEESCQPFIQGAPRITDYLDDASKEHFATVQRYLGLVGIPYVLNPRLVRGLDYYTRTTFEIFPSGREGSQSAVAAGGRYDGLIEQIGGPATPAVGFGSGIERAVLLLKQQEGAQIASPRLDVYICHMGPRAKDAAVWLSGQLRAAGVGAQVSTGDRSLRAQLRAANTASARYAFVIGDNEFSGPAVQDVRPVVRDLEKGAQTAMSLAEFLLASR